MAAPERFAEMSDSSCTAGAVHTWHFSELVVPVRDVRSWGKSGSGQRNFFKETGFHLGPAIWAFR
jgi:hypothetical protein